MNEVDVVLNCNTPSEFVKLAEKKVKDWNPREYQRKAGKRMATITNSQLRNVFDYVLKIKKTSDPNLQLLKPKLAYVKGKNKKVPDDFLSFLVLLIDGIGDNEKKLTNFKKFFESIVAYHKFIVVEDKEGD